LSKPKSSAEVKMMRKALVCIQAALILLTLPWLALGQAGPPPRPITAQAIREALGYVPAREGNLDASTVSSGILNGARLPRPGNSVLGGVLAGSAVPHSFMTGISTTGAPQFGRPSFADIAGTISNSQFAAATGTGALVTAHSPHDVKQEFVDLWGTGKNAPKVVVGSANSNAILGLVTEAAPYTVPGTERFAGAVNVFAALLDTAAGNSVYGLSGVTRMYATRGTATHEVDAHNKSKAKASTLLPPNTVAGTKENNVIGLIINSGGDLNSSIGLYVAQGLKDDQSGNTQWDAAGVYIHPHASDNKQIVVGGDSSSTGEGLVVERGGVGTHIRLKTYGKDQPNFATIYHQKADNSVSFSINQNGDFIGSSAILRNGVVTNNNSAYAAKDVEGVTRPILFMSGDNQTNTSVGGGTGKKWRILDQTLNTELLTVDNDGNTFISGTLSAGLGAVPQASIVCYNNRTGLLSYQMGTSCTPSARDLKSLEGPIDGSAVAALEHLHPMVYRYRPEVELDNSAHVGLFADDVERMDSRCVVYEQGRPRNFEDRCVIAYLVKAVGELQKENRNLRAQLRGLEKEQRAQ
jgi:hypothetical protein